MKLTVEQVVTKAPDLSRALGWGEVRLAPGLFRDLITLCARKSEASKYAFAVNVEMANFINGDDQCVITLSGEYRPAVQQGTRIGSYQGSDMHVIDQPCNKDCLMIMCLDEEDNVVHTELSLLKPSENQVNLVPVVTRDNVKALNGNFTE
jgi:hypothetical protein